MTKIIGDPGSCHMGDLLRAKELVKIGADCGLDAVKFQLLTYKELTGGNIELNWDWLPELIEYGKRFKIEVFASVFDTNGIDWLKECGCKSIKFPYSQQLLASSAVFKNTYISSGIMDNQPKTATNLYCIPQYPVPFKCNFDGIFPQFDGFSSHCMGIEQELEAVKCGAKVLEVHFQGNWEAECPDGKFAKRPETLEKLVKALTS